MAQIPCNQSKKHTLPYTSDIKYQFSTHLHTNLTYFFCCTIYFDLLQVLASHLTTKVMVFLQKELFLLHILVKTRLSNALIQTIKKGTPVFPPNDFPGVLERRLVVQVLNEAIMCHDTIKTLRIHTSIGSLHGKGRNEVWRCFGSRNPGRMPVGFKQRLMSTN